MKTPTERQFTTGAAFTAADADLDAAIDREFSNGVPLETSITRPPKPSTSTTHKRQSPLQEAQSELQANYRLLSEQFEGKCTKYYTKLEAALSTRLPRLSAKQTPTPKLSSFQKILDPVVVISFRRLLSQTLPGVLPEPELLLDSCDTEDDNEDGRSPQEQAADLLNNLINDTCDIIESLDSTQAGLLLIKLEAIQQEARALCSTPATYRKSTLQYIATAHDSFAMAGYTIKKLMKLSAAYIEGQENLSKQYSQLSSRHSASRTAEIATETSAARIMKSVLSPINHYTNEANPDISPAKKQAITPSHTSTNKAKEGKLFDTSKINLSFTKPPTKNIALREKRAPADINTENIPPTQIRC